MGRIFTYRGLHPKVADSKDVTFEVAFVSTGNKGNTYITVQDIGDFEIDDAGSVNLGRAADLRNKVVSVGSKLVNPSPEEDTIAVKYLINGKTIVEHNNPKKNNEQPRIAMTMMIKK
jgi:hypothetical protein